MNPVTLIYTNYRGEMSERTITPQRVWYGSTEWHPEPQWLITAFDHEKQANRDFALKDFGYLAPSTHAQALEEAAQVAENYCDLRDIKLWLNSTKEGVSAAICVGVAAAIRSLSYQPLSDGDYRIEVTPSSGRMCADMGGAIESETEKSSVQLLTDAALYPPRPLTESVRIKGLTKRQIETLASIDQHKVYRQKFGYGAWRTQGAHPTVVGKLISMGLAEWDNESKSFERMDCNLTDPGRDMRLTGGISGN